MTTHTTIAKLLKLQGLKLTGREFNPGEGALYLFVKPWKNGYQCPECERRCKIKRIMPEARSWRDVRVCGWTIFFIYRTKEIQCPTHGRAQEVVPWADKSARVTYRFEFLMLTYSQLMTQKAAAQLLNIPKSMFSDILHRTINRIRDGHRIRGPIKLAPSNWLRKPVAERSVSVEVEGDGRLMEAREEQANPR